MTTCPTALASTDKVLVPYLHPISLAQSARYFRIIKKQFDEQGIPVLYAPEEEWALKAAGIQNPLDTAQFPALLRQGFTHLLLIERVGTREGEGSFSTYTAYEVGQRNIPYQAARPLDELDKQATLSFQLLALNTRKVLFAGEVKTTVSPLVSPDDDGGETYVNLGSVDMATGKALKNGVKRLFAKCK